jgi:hypothetical protein
MRQPAAALSALPERTPVPGRLLHARSCQLGPTRGSPRCAAPAPRAPARRLAASSPTASRRPVKFGLRPLASGLAAQPLPLRPRRGRTRLPACRAARQRQRRRGRAGHHLAVARKAFTRNGLGMPDPNSEAVRQRAIAAARHGSGQPAPPATPPLDPMFVTLNRGQLPPRAAPNPNKACGSAGPRRSRRSATAPSSRLIRRAGSPSLAHRHHRPARGTRPAPGWRPHRAG